MTMEHHTRCPRFSRTKSPRIVSFLALVLLFAAICNLAACGARTNMPFNGQITFHEITLSIPENYIRDSTQSTEDLWIFEKGFYSQYIILSRQNLTTDAVETMDSYAAYLTQQGAQVQRGTFMDMEAVLSNWTMDGVFCQELIFVYRDASYAFSLRGGTDAEFHALYQTIEFVTDETAAS